MKKWLSTLAFAAAVSFAAGVLAVPPGQEVTWTTALGTVKFEGQKHADAGKQCTDCHDMTGGEGLFQMKKSTAKQTMAEMNEGKGCGGCHNGDIAFSTADGASCMKCHKQ